MQKFRWLVLAAFPALGACLSTQVASSGDGGTAPLATATLADARGQPRATATLTSAGDQQRLLVRASGMQPGVYGIHVHSVGACTPPDFTSAGPHWNPTSRQHGTRNPAGPHAGDLPNLFIGSNGEGSLDQPVSQTSTLLDTDGAALVIHAQADDYRTDPSGNSGTRIACGVFNRS